MITNTVEIKMISTMVILIVTMSILGTGNESSIDGCSANTKTGSASSSATAGQEEDLAVKCTIDAASNIKDRNNIID
jgi:hypothetical protein